MMRFVCIFLIQALSKRFEIMGKLYSSKALLTIAGEGMHLLYPIPCGSAPAERVKQNLLFVDDNLLQNHALKAASKL